MLNVDNTVAYLLERGSITAEAILFDDLCVTTATRRNPNIVVTHKGAGPDLLIKQVDAAVPGAELSLGLECAFYRFVEGSGKAELQASMTHMVALDEANRRLLIAFLPQAKTLWNHFRLFPPSAFPVDAVASLGAALATLHATPVEPDERRAFQGHLRSDAPWALRSHRPTPDLLATLSPANFEVLRIVQDRPELSRQLDALAELWRPTALIHGDMKGENVLVVAAAAEPTADRGGMGQAKRAEVKLVDWELVQFGDPAWDLAGVLQDLVLFWINTMSPAETVDDMVLSAVWPWAVVQPAFNALMRGYAGRSRLGADDFNALLLKAVRFCGARLVQTAFEMGQMSDVIPIPSVLLLQLSGNILADPQMAQVRLFRLMSRVGLAA